MRKTAVRVILALFVISGAMAAAIAYGLSVSNTKCAALKSEKIRTAVISHYLASTRGAQVSVPNSSGAYEEFPLYQYPDVESYSRRYPDCCGYYPGAIDGHPLSLFERLFEGKCGFVAITAHVDYWKGDEIVYDASGGGRIWIIDELYNLQKDPSER